MLRLCLMLTALMLACCAPAPAPAPISATQRQQVQQLDRALAGGIITRDQYEAQRRKILAPK